MNDDNELRDRLGLAALHAVLEASRSTEEGPAILKPGVAFDALIMAAAVVISWSPEVATPEQVEGFAAETAQKLALQISVAKRDPGVAAMFSEKLH